eukprot:GHVQ01023845.1.p1 GENE.GHVQ01023845.1~~GHVQ01023845.1.p1  ORF type:complete len:792 (-),score=94.44 GHVQ01023845.1:1231-3606(-)
MERNYNTVLQTLEQGLSRNLNLCQEPLYHLLKAQAHCALGNFDSALLDVEETYRSCNEPTCKTPLSRHDRVSMVVLLAELYARRKRFREAQNLLHNAMSEYQDVRGQGRLMIAKANLAVQRGDFQQAISILSSVKEKSLHYVAARVALANIYLHRQSNKVAYIKCFQDVTKENPSLQNLLLLGEAFMAIQRPAEAVATLEEALRAYPADSALVKRMGHALIQTHEYDKAIAYYHQALEKDGTRLDLRRDLADLFRRLQRWDEALTQLKEGERAVAQSSGDSSAVMTRAQYMTDVYQLCIDQACSEHTPPSLEMELYDRAIEALNSCYELLQATFRKIVSDDDFAVPLKKLAAHVCYHLAKLHNSRHKDVPAAISFFKRSLLYEDAPTDCHLQLAKLYAARDEFDLAERELEIVSQLHPDNTEATAWRVQLAANDKKSHEDGGHQVILNYCHTILQQRPVQFSALADILHMLRRTGRLEDIPSILSTAENVCGTSSKNLDHLTGFRYCRGLYRRWTHKPQDALDDLSAARRSLKFREKSIRQMIEIYLNPDDNHSIEYFVGTPVSQATREEHRSDIAVLLQELNACAATLKDPKIQAYGAEALTITHEKVQCEEAMRQLIVLLDNHRENITVLVTMSQTLLILKQQAKARNQLKRVIEIAKRCYRSDIEEDVEKAWLLLADLYIENKKYDLARPLSNMAKQRNKSCARAWEQLGIMYEKEQNYQEAATHYARAWKLHNEASQAVGYRLAFNYLKSKRHVDAINVCHAVLKIDPEYPKIKKDILDKCRAALRQ